MYLADGRIVDDFWTIELRFTPCPYGRRGHKHSGVAWANRKTGLQPAALTKNPILTILSLPGRIGSATAW